MNKKQLESQEKLAEAMSKLAGAIERFQDPVWIQKTFADAFQQMAGIELTAPVVARALPAGITLQGIIVTLSEEQRQELSQKIYEALSPQLQEFNQFVKDSLSEMPPGRLKELAERVERGEKPTIKRRRGCVFVETDGGYESYLGL